MTFYFILGDLLNVLTTPGSSPQKLHDSINWIALQFTFVACGAMVANFLSQFFLNWASERIGVNLRERYFDALTRQEIGFFDIKKIGMYMASLHDVC